MEADELLASTPGMTGIDYVSKREEWAYALETFQMLDRFRRDFIEEVQEMDERFYRQVVNGPAEDLSHVSMSEISIPNRTSLQNFDSLYQTYYEKKELTFQDFIGSPDMSRQPYVEGFSDIFQYDDSEYADLTMQERIRLLETGTVYENEFYMPEKEALLYLTEEYCLGFKQLYDGISEYDIITGEQLSQAERIERSDQGIIYLFLNALLLYQSVRSLGAVKKLVTLIDEGKIDDVLHLNNRGYFDFRKGGTSSVLENANYAQKTYSNTFSPEGIKKYSDLAGEPINTIDDLVSAINNGKINVSDLPIEYIMRDGNTLILNTRTSQALTQAGIPRSQWVAIDRTGNQLFEQLLDGQLSRNKLTSEGISTVRPGGKK